MLETNIGLVKFGAKLYLDTRYAEVIAQNISSDILEKACGELLKRYGLGAVKIAKGSNFILVATHRTVPYLVVEKDNWRMEIKDRGRPRRLHFKNPEDQNLIAQLLERCLIVQIQRRTDLWRLDSNRIWYQPTYFDESDHVYAYRRYEISSIAIEDIGVGIIIDVGTAFFSTLTIADFFREDMPEFEQKRLRRLFDRLSSRQQGQKGTLVYEIGNGKRIKCYFDSFCKGVNVASTGIIRLDGNNYDSLGEYYKRKHGLSISTDEPVAKVSFPDIDRPVPVAARMLRLRVMNDALPRHLNNVDKIRPAKRREAIEEFWAKLEHEPFGRGLAGVETYFWRPLSTRIIPIKTPDLLFGGGKELQAPLNGCVRERQKYYRDRLPLLRKAGCYHVPPAMTRILHVAVPRAFDEVVAEQLSEAVAKQLSIWTHIEITPEWFLYENLETAINKLRHEEMPGIVLFVFDQDDPATYFELQYQLQGWRIKRITQFKFSEFAAQFKFTKDTSNAKKVKVSHYPERWNSFIEMNALDVLQQMDCVPWAFAGSLRYESHLAVDVGADRRHFALSIYISRPQSEKKPFYLDTVVAIKADIKKETINKIHLRDEMIRLCLRAKQAGFIGIKSILILRDGHECGQEIDGINDAYEELVENGFLYNGAKIHIIDFQKNSLKGIRLWNCNQGKIEHAIEGTGLLINDRTVALVNTGAATLHQGTAEPVMLEVRNTNIDIDIVAVAADVHAACQLNWSSPAVAQRLPLELKRTDDELANKAAQEIRRIK
ncbi:MAG: hypothetical protein U1F76_18360 [Candidatus Competibacteraceae bacterium]